MENQISARERDISRQRITAPEHVYAGEFMKGEAEGLRLALGLPASLVGSGEVDKSQQIEVDWSNADA